MGLPHQAAHPRSRSAVVGAGALDDALPDLIEDLLFEIGRDRSIGLEFHNTGLYNLPGPLSYPADNPGAFAVTHDPKDVGKFKPPTLRNIAVTAPYMHDGSVATLEDAIDHYAAGGRTITTGPYQGVGRDNPNKAPAVRGFPLSADQKADLVEFLRSLTDDALLHDSRFADPWPAKPTTR